MQIAFSPNSGTRVHEAYLQGQGVSPICQTSAPFPLARASAVSVERFDLCKSSMRYIILSYYLRKFLGVHRLSHSHHLATLIAQPGFG